MKRHVLTVPMSIGNQPRGLRDCAVSSVCAGGSCASMLTGVQVFLISSAIGDLLDEKKKPNRARNSAVVLVTVFLVGFYSVTRYFH